MKHAYPFLILFALAFPACKKSDNITAQNALQGKWEIRITQAGMTPGTQYTAGSMHYLIFAGNNYQETNMGIVLSSGTFEIRTEPRPTNICLSGIPEEARSQIVWNPARGGEIPYFRFDGNRLKLYAGCSALDSGSYSEWERVE